MARCLSIFCLLLICASFVSVEPKITRKSSKTERVTKSNHHLKVYDNHKHETYISRRVHDQASQRHPVSGGAGYPSGSGAQTGNQAHGYPGSHGRSGNHPATSPPPAPYHPPVHETITQNRYTGSQATPSNTYSAGSGYPSGTQPPKTGNQAHVYTNSGSVTSSPYSFYPQSSPKPQASNQYPPNGGLSGNSREAQKAAFLSSSYPVGPGVSGNLGTNTGNQGYGYPNSQRNTSVPHSYPNNAGLSGGSSPAIQHASSSAAYPSNNGLSGTGQMHQQGGVANVYPTNVNKPPSVQTHSYPASNGQSGGGYKPQQGTGSSGSFYPQQTYSNHIFVRNHHTTNIHQNYIQRTNIHHHYRPPSHVYFVDNGMQYHYPVYKEKLPAYVYEYRSSRSRFRFLLAGLVLYNLGHLSKNHESHRYHNQYMPRPNEICRFIVRYDYAHQEEVDIDCRLITDFIWTAHSIAHNSPKIQTNLDQILQPNGALAQAQQFGVQNLQVIDALDPRFDGTPLQIQPGMKCYMKYSDGFFVNTEKYVSCGLLQKYDKMSFNSANKIAPTILMVVTTIALAMLN